MIQWFTLNREQTRPSPTGGESFTLGKLYLKNVLFCQTCEDEDRFLEKGGKKIPKVTAIPRGKYRLTNNFSHHFGKVLPEVLDVPGYEGVRIHGGNRAENSEGCILVGQVRTRDGIAECATQVQRVIDTIDAGNDAGIETWLEII